MAGENPLINLELNIDSAMANLDKLESRIRNMGSSGTWFSGLNNALTVLDINLKAVSNSEDTLKRVFEMAGGTTAKTASQMEKQAKISLTLAKANFDLAKAADLTDRAERTRLKTSERSTRAIEAEAVATNRLAKAKANLAAAAADDDYKGRYQAAVGEISDPFRTAKMSGDEFLNIIERQRIGILQNYADYKRLLDLKQARNAKIDELEKAPSARKYADINSGYSEHDEAVRSVRNVMEPEIAAGREQERAARSNTEFAKNDLNQPFQQELASIQDTKDAIASVKGELTAAKVQTDGLGEALKSNFNFAKNDISQPFQKGLSTLRDFDDGVKQVGMHLSDESKAAKEMMADAQKNVNVIRNSGGVEKFSKQKGYSIAEVEAMLAQGRAIGVPYAETQGPDLDKSLRAQERADARARANNTTGIKNQYRANDLSDQYTALIDPEAERARRIKAYANQERANNLSDVFNSPAKQVVDRTADIARSAAVDKTMFDFSDPLKRGIISAERLDAIIKEIGLDAEKDEQIVRRLEIGRAQHNNREITRAGGVKKAAQMYNLPVEDVHKAVEESAKLNENYKAMPSYWDRTISKVQTHLGYAASMGVAYAGIEAAMKGIEAAQKSITEASKMQVQQVLFQANQTSRMNIGLQAKGNTGDFTQQSIELAAKYGDKVVDVSQDLNLWYKVTGDLESASYLTGQALKFQVATGTDLEDTYRGLTALATQLGGVKLGGGLKGTFNLGTTSELLQMVTAAAVSAGAGLHQVTEAEKELHGATGNSAGILLEATEKDGAALKDLGLNMIQIVSLNQAMIQSFGNTAGSAGEVIEKISRLAGAFAGLSDPNVNKRLKTVGIDLSQLTTVQNSKQRLTVLEQFAKVYNHIGETQGKAAKADENYLAHLIGGQRQYQVVIDLIQALARSKKIETDVTKNMGLEDQIADKMNSTLEQSTKRMDSAWGALGITVGLVFLPILTNVVDYMATTAVPAIERMVASLGHGLEETGAVWGVLNAPVGTEKWGKAFDNFVSVENKGSLRAKQESSGPVDRYGWTEDQRKAQDSYGAWNAQYKGNILKYKPYKWKEAWSSRYTFLNQDSLEAQSDVLHQGAASAAGARTAAIKAALAKLTDPLKNTQGNLTGTGGKTKGQSTDYADFASASKDKLQAIDALIDADKRYIKSTDEVIAADDRHNSKFGLSADSVAKTKADMRTKQAQLLDEQNNAYSGLKEAQAQKAEALAKRDSKPKGSTEWNGWNSKAQEAESKIQRYKDTINEATIAVTALHDAVTDVDEAFDKQSNETFFSNYAKGLEAVKKSRGRHNDTQSVLDNTNKVDAFITKSLPGMNQIINELSAIPKPDKDQKAQLTEDTRKRDEAVTELNNNEATKYEKIQQNVLDLQKAITQEKQKGLDFLLKESSINATVKTYYQDMLSLASQKSELDAKYAKDMKDDTSDPEKKLIQQWYDLSNAELDAEAAAAKYKERVDQIANSPLFKGAEVVFKDLTSSLSGTLTDDLFGGNTTKTQDNIKGQFDSVVAGYENVKNAETLAYDSKIYHTKTETALHKVRMQQLDEQMRKEKQLEAQKVAQAGKVSLFDKIGKDFAKSIVDSLITQLQAKMKTDIINKLLGTKNGQDPNKQLETSIAQHVKSIEESFKPSVTIFSKSADGLVNPINKFNTVTENLTRTLNTLNGYLGDMNTGTFGPTSTGSNPGGGGFSLAPGVGGSSSSIIAGILAGGGGLASILKGNGGGGGGGGGGTPGPDATSLAKKGAALADRVGTGLAGLSMALNGNKQGGIAGGVETGMGVASMITSIAPHFGPWGMAIAGAAAIYTALSHHDNAAAMPDKYDTANFTTDVGELQGSAGTGYGPSFNPSTDPVMQALGGKSELQYVQDWIAKNQNSSDPNIKALAQQLLPQYGTTGGGKLNFDPKNIGNESVAGGNLSGTYADLNATTQQTISQIQQLGAASAASAQQQLVSINSFGGNAGYSPAAWNTPGYEWPAGYPGTGQQANQNNSSFNGASSTPPLPGGDTRYLQAAVTVVTNLDGRQIARSTQSYVSRSNAAGYAGVS